MADVHLFRSTFSGAWCHIGNAESLSTNVNQVTCLVCLRYALSESMMKQRTEWKARETPGFLLCISPDVPPGEIHFVDHKTRRLKGMITGLNSDG